MSGLFQRLVNWPKTLPLVTVENAQKVLVELQEPAAGIYVPPYMVAAVYAGLGDKDQAFAWLERAYTERSLYLTWLPMDPVWNDLHADPRFAALLKKVGFPG